MDSAESLDNPEAGETGLSTGDSDDLVHGSTRTMSRGQVVLHPDSDNYHELVEALSADGYAMCVDLTVVDYLGSDCRDLPSAVEPQRFELVVGFLDLVNRRRVRVRTQLQGSDPSIETITDLYPGAEALEREAYDMFGVSFTGHPDPTRILMPESWDGFPLRKDYDIGRIPVQFKEPTAGGRGRTS